MKKLALLLTLLVPAAMSAQKVDLDPYNFTFELRDLPHTIINPSLKTYSVLASAGRNISNAMSPEAIASKIVLHGFDRVGSGADVQIYVRLNDLILESNDVKEHVSESKDKEGNVTRTYSYTLSIKYSISGTAEVSDKTMNPLIKSYNLFGSGQYEWTKNFDKSGAAYDYYNSNRSSIASNLANEKITAAIAEMNGKFNYEMGFPPEKQSLYLWLVDNKKHPEHEIMVKRWETFKPILQGVTANTMSDDVRKKVLEEIEYFNSLKTKYPTDDKGESKIRYAAFYNSALLYMLLDDPEKSIPEADGLVANEYDAKDGKQLKEKATALIELFKKNNIYTRHFNAQEPKPYKN